VRHNGTLSRVKDMIKIMLVRGVGIRDIGIIIKISAGTVLKVLKSTKYRIKPKQNHYDCLEIDEFWTYVGKSENCAKAEELKRLGMNHLAASREVSCRR
jgi:hypothetical protein